jgi:hypothetical protein
MKAIFYITSVDELVKSRHSGENRSPENFKVFEITGFRRLARTRSGVRRNDGNTSFQTFYQIISVGFGKNWSGNISWNRTAKGGDL